MNHPKAIVFIAFISVSATGCASSQLRDTGSHVQVTGENAITDCEYIGPITSRVGANFGSYQGNVEAATNEVRNQAAERGATHVVLSPPIKDSQSEFLGGGCNNCVALTGQAYRCTGRREPRQSPMLQVPLPSGMGEERGACYPNSTCNSGLVCLSNLCVNPAPSPTPTNPSPVDNGNNEPKKNSELPPPPVPEVKTLVLGTLDAATKAEPKIREWKGRPVKITMKDGTVLADILATVRALRVYFSDGKDVDLLEATEITVQD